MSALTALGPVVHEQPLTDGSKPDFQLKWPLGPDGIELVGDITAASDKGLDDNNPVEQFWTEIVRLARKYKLNPNHLRFDVGHRMVGEYRDAKMLLALPPRAELRNLIKTTVEPYIVSLAKGIADSPALPYSKDEVQFTISYNPSQEFAGGSYISYATPYSLTKNPLHTALEKKASQLKAAPSDAIRLVILCDAACHAMQNMTQMGGALTATQVVTEYLKNSSTIDLVLLVTVTSNGSIFAHDRTLKINCTLLSPPNRHRNPRLTESAIQSVSQLLTSASGLLPKPVLDPRNAMLRFELPNDGPRRNGYKMSKNDVSLSSRLVLELLAGAKTIEEVESSLGWDDGSNPFRRLLAQGQLIEHASLTSGGDTDDDWLDLHFNDGDPAVSMFTDGRE